MSQSDIRNTKNIAKNTVFLYIRSIIVMAVGIFTSRVILQALGVDDYGVYNVIGGFVAMFSIISASLVNASQRFISFEMGKEKSQMNRVFCGTMSIHLLLGLLVLIAFETFGLWFLNAKLNIAPDRMTAANWVFQCSVLTFIINLISVPYNACIISHEKMNVFAYISIYESFAKLGIVYLLWVTGFDKLIVYAILLLLVSGSLRLIYGVYCKRHFEECRFHFKIDKPLFKEMIGFIGWNFIGSAAGILTSQGINILVNIFFGVALNAARGLAEQVNQAINTFVNNFMTAMNPQITKSYASRDFIYMNMLIIRGGKYAGLLYWCISLIFFVEVDYILSVWLVEVPPFSGVFIRLVILYSLFLALSNPLYVGMLASGNIKKYQIIMGTLGLGAFILCFIVFKVGLGPEWSYLSLIIISFIQVGVRLKLIKEIIPGFSPRQYLTNAILKVVAVVFASLGIQMTILRAVSLSGLIEFIISLCIALITMPILVFSIALDSKERSIILNQIKSRVNL